MANEGVIKAQYALAGEADITAKILKPDDTVRDAQTAVALDDSGHANVYTNAGAITIEAGDSIIAYDGAVNIGGETYLPEVTVNNIAAMVTAVWAKAMSDLAQGIPSATASVLTAINYLYMALRNKITTTSTEMAVYKDDGTTKAIKAVLSDDGSTFTKEEFGSG